MCGLFLMVPFLDKFIRIKYASDYMCEVDALSVYKSPLYHTNHVAITVYGVQEKTNASTWMQDIFSA